MKPVPSAAAAAVEAAFKATSERGWSPGAWSSTQRLYTLEGPLADAGLHVEAWAGDEAINAVPVWEITCLATDAWLPIDDWLAQPCTLVTHRADGSRHRRSGVVMAAEADTADGGLARYRIRVQPWLALLGHSLRSQVWQDRNVVAIVEAVFARHAPLAQWRWTPDCSAHLARSPWSNAAGERAYCVQYRESDLAFVRRLLAQEGLNLHWLSDDGLGCGERLTVFADNEACPLDATSAEQGALRFHRAASQEQEDAVQAFGAERQLTATLSSTLSWNPERARSMAAAAPTRAAFGGPNAPRLEAYAPLANAAFETLAQAERAVELAQQRLEARHKRWIGRATVRSLSAGSHFRLDASPLDRLQELLSDDDAPADRTHFLVTRVQHAGINNLPRTGASSADAAALLPSWLDAAVVAQARASGYGNRFEASRHDVPWRPEDRPKPRLAGPLLARVCGPDGQTHAHGADEIHRDAMGRIRIRHEFQGQPGEAPETSGASAWVRVVQRWAGDGMGLNLLPRIGQQVLVDFIDGDIDRPLVVAALYTGRGEGGVPATPGGAAGQSDRSVFAHSTDSRPAGQGNLTGGHAPPWHGAAPEALDAGGQANAAALSGWKSKEFGGSGFNQLVFDDSDGAARVQWATTQAATQLNLGHLIHQADNHRGSHRGTGFELRTDAWGSVRSGAGLLLSTFATQPDEPAGDNPAGVALAGQLKALGQTLSQAAARHQTVALAGHLGALQAGASHLDKKAAPWAAWHTTLRTVVAEDSAEAARGDAAARRVATGAGSGVGARGAGEDHPLPHLADAAVTVSARAGLTATAAQDFIACADETLTFAAGGQIDIATGGAARIHTGQAIGMLAGAIAPGQQAVGTGLTLIAAGGPTTVQAQAGPMEIAARDAVSLGSRAQHIELAAAKRIVLQTAGGASVTIEGGNITFACPGKITVNAGRKSFTGPGSVSHPLPAMPGSICVACLKKSLAAAPAFTRVE